MNDDSFDSFTFLQHCMRQMQEGAGLPPMFFEAKTASGWAKTSVHAIDPNRAHFPFIVCPQLDVFKPEHCIVEHLKSCNVANGFEVVYPQLQ
jgi:hypothetical protein